MVLISFQVKSDESCKKVGRTHNPTPVFHFLHSAPHNPIQQHPYYKQWMGERRRGTNNGLGVSY